MGCSLCPYRALAAVGYGTFSPDYRARYTELVFGGSTTPVKPSLAGSFGFYDQMTNGNVNFLNAGIVGPIPARDIPGTPADESKLSGTPTGNAYASLVLAEAARSGFDFRPFDKNRDGVIRPDELSINIINSNREAHEFFATTEWPPVPGHSGPNVFNDLGYAFIRHLGYIYSPSLSAAPDGTRALHFWHDPTPKDNYTTTRASHERGVPAGYTTDRAFGYVFAASRARPANTVEIFTWYNPVRRDYLLTTTGGSSPEARALREGGYSLVRGEGFIFDPALPQPRDTTPLYLWEGNGLVGGAQKIGIDVGLTGGLRIQTNGITVVQDAVNNLSVLGHEMIHYVGGVDVYGAGFGKNYQYSLMAAIQGGIRLSHPDPMNKILMGWIEPIVRQIGTEGPFEILATENPKNSTGKAYVFYDPARGKREFFILEYRHTHQLSGRGDLIPLYNLWDSDRGDNWATTSHGGDVLFGPSTLSSRFHKIEGFVFTPANPPPAGTVPLYGWYSSTYGDGFTTTNPAWAGVRGDRRRPYVSQGVLGYVYDPALARPANTLPLYSWFSPSRSDNYLTADQTWGMPRSLLKAERGKAARLIMPRPWCSSVPRSPRARAREPRGADVP